MDPLSLSTTIIALIGTARKTSEYVSKLAGLGHAHQQLQALYNDLSGIGAILDLAERVKAPVRETVAG